MSHGHQVSIRGFNSHLQSAARLHADHETRPGRWGGREGIDPAHGQVVTNVLWPSGTLKPLGDLILFDAAKGQTLPCFRRQVDHWYRFSTQHLGFSSYVFNTDRRPRFFHADPPHFAPILGVKSQESISNTTVRVRKQKLLLIRHHCDDNGENDDNYGHLNGENCYKP